MLNEGRRTLDRVGLVGPVGMIGLCSAWVYKVGEHLIGWGWVSSGNDSTVLPLGCEYKVGEHLIGWGWGV